MIRYIVLRLRGLLLVLFGVSVLSFLLLALSGNDPAEIAASRGMIFASPDAIEALRDSLQLGGSLPQRYGRWIMGLLTGNTGISIYSRRAISQDIAEYLPVSLSLMGLSLVFIVTLSLLISLLSVRYKDTVLDRIFHLMTLLGICVPPFWLGYMLLSRYAVTLQMFSVMPQPGIRGYILPALSLAIPAGCSISRLMRAALLSELAKDYVLYAKSRGIGPARILTRHVLRNALPPILTVFVQYMGFLLAGAAAVESVFTLKGLGSYLIGCVAAADAAAVSTCVLLIATVFVLGNLLADIANRLLCPVMLGEGNA